MELFQYVTPVVYAYASSGRALYERGTVRVGVIFKVTKANCLHQPRAVKGCNALQKDLCFVYVLRSVTYTGVETALSEYKGSSNCI